MPARATQSLKTNKIANTVYHMHMIFLWFIYFYYHQCFCPMHVCVRISDPLELKLQAVVMSHERWDLNPHPLEEQQCSQTRTVFPAPSLGKLPGLLCTQQKAVVEAWHSGTPPKRQQALKWQKRGLDESSRLVGSTWSPRASLVYIKLQISQD